MPNNSIKLFISYSHDDESYFKVFSEGLRKVVKNAEHFDWSLWDDRNIHIGTFWDDEIQENIKDCNVAMLLVSIGFMASKYIKESEYNEFIKRYKEKGILIVPIVFAPCDFNRWEDLGKLQFFKPNGSNYGKPEIENFTYADLIEFRKTDGIIIPNPNIGRYHLDLVKRVEGSFREFLKRTQVEELRVSQITLYQNMNKLSDYPKPNILFTGRRNEINDFQKKNDSFRIFVIEGLGGTGKTQFAAKCIEEIIPDKNRIIWLNGSVQSNFDVFVESAGYGDVLKGEKKSDLALYSGFKDLIEKDEKVIFWDNFNDYEDIAFSNFLSFAYQYLRRATIILITKTEPSIPGITSLPIVRLEGLDEDSIKYAKKLKESDGRYNSISDSDLETICNGTDGHPLAIEFSMWLMGYGKSADDIMSHMPEFSGSKKGEEFSKRLFLDIFNHNKTSDEERDCFLKCSIFKERITEDEIKFLYDGKEVFYLLAGLMDKLLITFKEGLYEIHPLVRSFSYEKLSNKKSVHKKAADYFITKRDEKLNASLEEKIFYHLSEAQEWLSISNFIEKEGRNLIQQGQLRLITESLIKLEISNISRPVFEILNGDIAQIKSDWKRSITHFSKASQNSEDIKIKAEGLIKFGEILYRTGNIKESLKYFESAYEFAKLNYLSKEEARALNDIGLVHYDFDNQDISFEKLMMALKIRQKINDLDGIATSYNNIGNFYNKKGKYEKALEHYYESIKIAEINNNNIELLLYLGNIGDTLRLQKKFDQAIQKTNSALRLSEEIGNKENIASCNNIIGLIFSDQGKYEDGLLKYQESLKVFEEIGDKGGISAALHNIGAYYGKVKKDYENALNCFFQSLGIKRQIGNKERENDSFDWVVSLRKEIGKEKFKKLANQVFNKLTPEMQKFVPLVELLNEPVIAAPKIGRNDPCQCGSGKKYKHCHGKN